MESYSFLASLDTDPDVSMVSNIGGGLNISSTQVRQSVPRSQLFDFTPPPREDFRNMRLEEEKREIRRQERDLARRVKVRQLCFLKFSV